MYIDWLVDDSDQTEENEEGGYGGHGKEGDSGFDGKPNHGGLHEPQSKPPTGYSGYGGHEEHAGGPDSSDDEIPSWLFDKKRAEKSELLKKALMKLRSLRR